MTRFYHSNLHRYLFSFVMMVSILTSHPAFSQKHLVRAVIPFAFENGGQRFPAGPYTIASPSPHVIAVRSGDGKQFSYAIANLEQRTNHRDSSTLIFHRVGGRLFLSEFWIANSDTGLRCVRTRAERAALVTAHTTPQADVQLALK